MNDRTRLAPPQASAMMEALRGLGYSTAAALADIVDNSISAGAVEVRIDFSWDGKDSRISIQDDGHGMDDRELEQAMTLGMRSPLDRRSRHDLGRFGMGLKTASLSQCRRLTVASLRRGGIPCCLRWDLDELATRPDDGWVLFEGAAAGSESFARLAPEMPQGTLVLWERLDRIVTDSYTSDDLLNLIDGTELWLGMVFHRLLAGPRPRLRVLLNGSQVPPWDPFLTGHPAKAWESPVERIETSAGSVEIECHVLPHRDRLPESDYRRAAGPGGWATQQGFYVYRNERLLLAGGWLGLGDGGTWNREEAYRLARIRLEIPNTADAEWKVDIRKSVARPPVALRPWLTRLATDTRERARKVFAFRGTPVTVSGRTPVAQAWRVDQTRDGVHYRIDESHPAVAGVLSAAEGQADLIRAMLRIIEETVPVQRIWLDTTENRDVPRTGFVGDESGRVRAVLQTLFDDMTGRRGMSREAAIRLLSTTEPFNNHSDLVASLDRTATE